MVRRRHVFSFSAFPLLLKLLLRPLPCLHPLLRVSAIASPSHLVLTYCGIHRSMVALLDKLTAY